MEKKLSFVNVYEVTRHYGGDEEGGWWYNYYDCIESIPCEEKYSDTMTEHLANKYKGLKHGNIYSVLGGVDIEVLTESEPAESQTKETPRYE